MKADISELNKDFAAAKLLDCSGLLCPEPVLQAALEVKKMHAGERLHVILTDPHGPLDFEVFCQRGGHRLLHCSQTGDQLHLLMEIRKSEAD